MAEDAIQKQSGKIIKPVLNERQCAKFQATVVRSALRQVKNVYFEQFMQQQQPCLKTQEGKSAAEVQ